MYTSPFFGYTYLRKYRYYGRSHGLQTRSPATTAQLCTPPCPLRGRWATPQLLPVAMLGTLSAAAAPLSERVASWPPLRMSYGTTDGY